MCLGIHQATHSKEQQAALVAGLGEGLLLVPEGGDSQIVDLGM